MFKDEKYRNAEARLNKRLEASKVMDSLKTV